MQQIWLFFSDSWSFLKGHIHLARGRHIDTLACKEFSDSQNLQARMCASPGRVIKSCICCFCSHRLCWFLESDEDTYFSIFTLDDTAQVSYIFDAGMASFDRKNHLFLFAAFSVIENVEATVDALIRPFLLLCQPRAY